MGLFKLVELSIIIILISINYCFALSAVSKKWYPRDLTSEQDLRSLLDNIYDNLRRVESIQFRMDSLETILLRMINKIDSLDSHLNSVQTSMNYRMSELYSIVLKYDMQREQIVQKYETSQSRMIMNINKLETHIEDSLNKLQGNSDVNLVKIENKQNDMINKVIELNSSIDKIRSHTFKLEDRINNTQIGFMQHFQNSEQQLAKKDHLDKIENKINGLHSRFNKTEIMWTQNDSPKNTQLEQKQIVNDIKSELISEGSKMGNKVSSMYNEIWKKIASLEYLIKENIIITNITQKELQEGLRAIFMEHRENEDFVDVIADKMLTELQSKIADLHHRVDNNFQTLASAQTVVSGTCQRINDVASGYGSRIELVLQKLVDAFYNKTDVLSKENINLLEALKGHNSQMIRTVSDAKNMVITLAEENSHDHKTLDNSIVEVGKKADIVAATVEELQDQFEDMNVTFFNPGYNYIDNSQAHNNTKLQSSEDKNISISLNNNNNNQTVSVVEANYSNGVIKIITDDILPRLDKRESIIDSNDNGSIINLKINTSNKNSIEKILYLNNTLSTSKITGIISSSNANNSSLDENNNNLSTTNVDNNQEHSDNVSKKKNSGTNKETTSVEDEDIETSFILSYINFIKGRINKEEFLQEGYPGKSFRSIQEMIAYMKQMKNIKNEYLRELDKYDREESESDNIGRRGDFFDTTNLEYEDLTDEFIT